MLPYGRHASSRTRRGYDCRPRAQLRHRLPAPDAVLARAAIGVTGVTGGPESVRRRTALLAVFVALALLHTWPLASAPGSLSRLDNADSALNTWIVAWVSHILPRDPTRLFEAPIFHPEHHALAYSEHLLVPALIGAPLS